MRDPARIDSVLSAIRELWTEHPDFRLGQLLVNAVHPTDPIPELFMIEDTHLMHKLGELAEHLNDTRWAVHRVDNNGNEFVVESGLTKAAADARVAELESHGHKQHYWSTRLPQREPRQEACPVESLNEITSPDYRIARFNGCLLSLINSLTDDPEAWHAQVHFEEVSYLELPTHFSHARFREATNKERATIAKKTPLQENDTVIAIIAETMAQIEPTTFFVVCESVSVVHRD